MATRTIRPKVRNGQVVRRTAQTTGRKRAANAGSVASRARGASSGARRRKSSSPGGSRVYWMLVLVAAMLASGFIYTLRSKISIHRLGQMESKLKDDLDEIANRQRYAILEQQRAINPQQSDSAARQAGLIQPRLVGARIAPEGPIVKKAARQETGKPAVKQAARRSGRRQ